MADNNKENRMSIDDFDFAHEDANDDTSMLVNYLVTRLHQAMADNNKENRMSIDDFDFAHEDANDDTSMLVNYLVTRLHKAMGNPALQGEVQQQLHAYGILPPIQQERGLERFQGEKPPKEDSLRKKEWRTPIKSSSNSLKGSHHPRRKAMLNMKGVLQGREKKRKLSSFPFSRRLKMGEDGIAGPPAKKRGAARQISKDDGSDSEGESFLPSESGSFQKASEDVIASRRIVKVRRTPAAQGPSAPNPFASIRLVASGVPPIPSTSVTALAPSGEIVEEVAVVKDLVTEVGSTDAVPLGKRQDEMGEVEATGESADLAEAKTHVETGAVEEQGKENGKGKLEMHKFSKVDEDANKNVQSVNVDDKSEGVIGGNTGKSDDGLSSDIGKEDAKSLSDNRGKVDVDEKEPGESEQGDAGKNEESVALAASNALDERAVSKETLPPIGTATSGSFSFGTAPSSFETPTAFASFSSTWSAFGSGASSGTSSGTGFGFSKAASDAAFGSASSPFGNSNGSSFQLFNTQSSSVTLSAGPPSQPPASAAQFQGGTTPTGEEQEKIVFGADATLFEFIDAAWKERGKGELRVNVPLEKSGKARLLMRSKGNLRLILNASLFPDMKMTSMDSRGVTFVCVNSAVEEKSGLTTYALKFKDSIAAVNFRDAVDAHKSPSQVDLKTPENSPSLHGL
ncbi:hypothetical protein L7F22_053037 [Adiantum nelumboides]|nr:hypothetical protein [Adiantum nelumboides]